MSNINTLTEIVEKQWSRNINKKVNTAKRLIEFKSIIRQKNSEMIQIYNNDKISIITRKFSIIAIKKYLIGYIGTWTINIQQGLLSYRKIHKSLDYFIDSEYILLKPLIQRYLQDKSNIHYSDAICCYQLFCKCFK